MLALLGWLFNHEALAQSLPAIANMTFNTAFCFAMLSSACLLANGSQLGNKLAILLSITVMVMAVLTLSQGIFHLNLGIDQMLFDSRPYAFDSLFPGRMSMVTALAFLLASLCFIALMREMNQRVSALLTHSFILLIALLGLLGVGMNLLMGDAPKLFSHLASVSLMTALSFLLLALSLLGRFSLYHSSAGSPILYAGIRLMFGLKYPQKFALISIIFAAPLIILMSNQLSVLQQRVDTSYSKITGAKHIHKIVDLIEDVAAHRGMLNTHLSKRTLFIAELNKENTAIEALIAENKQENIKYKGSLNDWQAISLRWDLIKEGGLKASQSWRLHSEMIVLLRKQLADVGRVTQLSYDANPLIHNLVSAQLDVLPQLFEMLGQLRGQGSEVIAAGKTNSNSSLLLSHVLSQASLLLMEYRQLNTAAWEDQPQLPALLQHEHSEFVGKSYAFFKQVNQQLLQENAFSMSSKAYFLQASQALSAGSILSHHSLEYVQALLQERIETDLNKQYMLKLIVLLVSLVILYLFAAFYQSVMQTISIFRSSVHAIRNGRLKELSLLPARDEMVDAFNSVTRELVHTDSQMSAVIDYAVDGIITVAADGSIQSMNPAAEQLFDYRMEELEGESVSSLIPEAYRLRYMEELDSYMNASEGAMICSSIDIHGLKKNQSEIPVSLSISSVEIYGQRIFIAMIRDVTHKHALEYELRQAQKMQSIGVLVGGIAHNFNNMLAALIGQNYLAQMACKENPEVMPHLLEVEKITQQAADMVKQLLTYAHKDFFRQKQDASLTALIEESFAMVKLGIPENIQLDLVLSDTAMSIHCDTGQIQQVLINMVNNARDAVEHNDEKIIHVSLQLYQPEDAFFERHSQLSRGNFACLEVRDNGHGMTGDIIEQIFDPFFTSKDVGRGTGLGLSTAFGSISAHGGVIEVDSDPQHGSCFSVYLPLLTSSKLIEKPVQESISYSQHGETILLVDDEDVVLSSTHKVLEKLGYQVLTAKNGKQGLQCFIEHQNNIDIIISDVVMPNMGGLDMCRGIREMQPDALAILMTGYDQGGVALQGDEDLITKVLSKPVPIAILSQEIALSLSQ